MLFFFFFFAKPGLITLCQAPTLSVSTTSFQMRQVWRWALAQLSAMQMTVVNPSLTHSFSISTHHWLPVSSQTNQPASKRGELIWNDDDSGLGFAAFAMFVTSLNKRTYSYHANNAGLCMSRSALAWGRFEHVSEIRE